MHASASVVAITGLVSAICLGSAGRSVAARDPGQDRGAQIRGARAAIAAFDDCLQQRFKDIDQGFGFRRIIKVGETPHRFKPENAREESVVRDLEREGLRVVLYLTGRRVLTDGGGAPGAGLGSPLIKGPVEVTSARRPGDPHLEPPLDLRDESRRAMTTFDRASSYEFTAGDWSFIARPVRASDASCVRCHMTDGRARMLPSGDQAPSLQIGDALGTLLYGYKSAR